MLTSDEEMERNLSEWRRMDVLYKCTVCTIKYQNKQKEWHHATKPVKNSFKTHSGQIGHKIWLPRKKSAPFVKWHFVLII